MNNENVPAFPDDWVEDEYTESTKLKSTHREIRHAAKEVGMLVENLPTDYPDRGKVVQLANEILALVPVYDQADEEYDERQFQLLEESRQRNARAFAEWKTRHQ